MNEDCSGLGRVNEVAVEAVDIKHNEFRCRTVSFRQQ